jgi:hypothetical protein
MTLSQMLEGITRIGKTLALLEADPASTQAATFTAMGGREVLRVRLTDRGVRVTLDYFAD